MCLTPPRPAAGPGRTEIEIARRPLWPTGILSLEGPLKDTGKQPNRWPTGQIDDVSIPYKPDLLKALLYPMWDRTLRQIGRWTVVLKEALADILPKGITTRELGDRIWVPLPP